MTLLDDPRLAVVVFDKEAAHLPLLASSNVDNASGRILFTGESSGQGVENEGNLAASQLITQLGVAKKQ